MMASFVRSFVASAALAAMILVAFAPARIALAQGDITVLPTPTPTPTPTTPTGALPPPGPTPTPTPSPSPAAPSPTPTPTGANSSGASINGLANQHFNQMITDRVLGTVLLGVNEQVNCSDCISAFGSAGSFSAGIHGRKEITPNLSFLGGIAYTQFSESGYSVTSAPIAAFALRYDFTDWGSSRPFFDIGTILTPFEKVNYSRAYVTSLGAVSLQSSTNASDYDVYGRAGWIGRLSPRDEIAASVEVWPGSCGSASAATAIQLLPSTPSTPPLRPVPIGPTWSRSADNGRTCSAAASKATSMAASCSHSAITPASSPP